MNKIENVCYVFCCVVAMELSKETFLMLASDQKGYTNNRADNFKARLPMPVRLASGVDWYMSCNNLVVPRTIKQNIPISKIIFYQSFSETDNRQKYPGRTKTIAYDQQNHATKGVIGRLKKVLKEFNAHESSTADHLELLESGNALRFKYTVTKDAASDWPDNFLYLQLDKTWQSLLGLSNSVIPMVKERERVRVIGLQICTLLTGGTGDGIGSCPAGNIFLDKGLRKGALNALKREILATSKPDHVDLIYDMSEHRILVKIKSTANQAAMTEPLICLNLTAEVFRIFGLSEYVTTQQTFILTPAILNRYTNGSGWHRIVYHGNLKVSQVIRRYVGGDYVYGVQFVTGQGEFDIFNDSAQHSHVFTSPVSIPKSQVGISQSLAPTLKVKIDDLFDPADAHLVQDIDLLRNVSRCNIQSIKMGQKRGLDDNKKNHMVQIDLYTHHAKRVRASRKTIDELHVTILDGQDQPVVFGDGKTHLNMFLTPMKKSVYPLEFTILIPFNETLTLKQPVPFDGRREVGVMQIELPTNFNNVLQDEMKITVSKVVTPRYGAKTIDYTVPMGNYTEKTLI